MEKGLIVHTAIINGKNQVLILKRSASNEVLPGYWDIPGGTLEDGEDPEKGAIRETKEEAGIIIEDPILFYHTSDIDVMKNKQFVRLIFYAKIGTDRNITLDPGEHEEYEWINICDIGKYKTVEYLGKCLNKLSELLKIT